MPGSTAPNVAPDDPVDDELDGLSDGASDAEDGDDLDIDELRDRLLRHVAEAVEAALGRLRSAAAGERVFHSDLDLRATREVAGLLPLLLTERHIAKRSELPAEVILRYKILSEIPPCPSCGGRYGGHRLECGRPAPAAAAAAEQPASPANPSQP